MAVRERLRLGVRIDHVATLRNARSPVWPDPLRAALLAEASGADCVIAHLREDRSHIQDDDMDALIAGLGIPLNFECAATVGMQEILLRLRPHSCNLVPEIRNETGRTRGFDVLADEARLQAFIAPLRAADIRVSLGIDHDHAQIEAAARSGAAVVELHTGAYSALHAAGQQSGAEAELCALREAAGFAVSIGLEVHAGHGLSYENIDAVAAIRDLREVHVGHFLIREAVYTGLGPAIEEMRRRIDAAG